MQRNPQATGPARPPIRPAMLELIGRAEADPATRGSDEGYFLEQLRAVIGRAETPAAVLLAKYRPDRVDDRGRIYARYAE